MSVCVRCGREGAEASAASGPACHPIMGTDGPSCYTLESWDRTFSRKRRGLLRRFL